MKRNTIQKTIILDTLRELNCHASAGMVYDAIREKYPTISRGTVFRVLSEAAEEGTLLRLHLAEAEDRFDITLRPHFHITCRKCGFVRDIEVTDGFQLSNIVTDTGGFQVEEYHLELMGICPDCQKKSELVAADPS